MRSHTAKVAEALNKSVKEAGANVSIIQINKDKPDNLDWDLLDNADAIIFGVPTYMGSLAGSFKIFMEATSTRWAQQKWQDKIAATFLLLIQVISYAVFSSYFTSLCSIV
ncbi:flavodoxin family protein [Rickettsia massiliae]|uniref:flavodoxin family protein n=1 Tax=Rickettsia massiliae TaxID=35791 RepID=UPI0009D75F20|nr:flavodoxin family protein [Rickettsia massiliae]